MTLLWASGARVVLWWDKLFTVPYFPKGSSRLSALRYGLPSCMSVKTIHEAGVITRHPPMLLGFESWHRCHVGWVCCWFALSFSERFFSGFSSFHLSLKTNTFKNPIWSGMHRHVSTSWEQQRTPKCTVGKQIILHFLTIWWPVSHSHELTILISHSFSKSHSPINFWSRYRVCVQVRYIDIVNSIQRKHLMISFDYLVVKAWIA